MQVTDPRDRVDDLLVTESSEELPPAEFEEAAASEAATMGWVVVALTFDADGRVLLVDQPWADGWLAPGGAAQPGESLDDAIVREIEEETGVVVDPVAPRALDDFSFVNGDGGETAGWKLVVYETEAQTTDLDDDLGLDGEAIDDARWFQGLPDDIYNPDLFEPVYERCVNPR